MKIRYVIHHLKSDAKIISRWTQDLADKDFAVAEDLIQKAASDKLDYFQIYGEDDTVVVFGKEILKECIFEIKKKD